MSTDPRKVTNVLRVVTAIVLGVSALATIGWAVVTLRDRAFDGVEGAIFAEAMRVRNGPSLYFDPIVGTSDVPPTRMYVLYPPLWSAAMSLFPTSIVPLIARGLATLVFLAALALIARRSRPAWLGVGFVLAFYPLVLFGTAGRPDALALFVATFAFARTLEKRGVDALAGAAFALAVFIKPNVMGLAAGSMLVALFTRFRATIPALVAGLVTALVVGGALTAASGMTGSMPTFVVHLLRSTGQPPSLSLWTHQVGHRLPFVAFPLVAACAYSWPVRSDARVRFALAALATSTAWALTSLAKIGSASNYWLEPAIAAIGCVASADDARRAASIRMDARPALVLAALLCVQSIHNGVAAVRSSIEGLIQAPAQPPALAAIRARCRKDSRDVVMGDEPGVEIAINGRPITTQYQMSHQFARGTLPREPWLAYLDDPHVKCLVLRRAELEGPQWSIEDRLIDPIIRESMREKFKRVTGYVDPTIEQRSGIYLYERR